MVKSSKTGKFEKEKTKKTKQSKTLKERYEMWKKWSHLRIQSVGEEEDQEITRGSEISQSERANKAFYRGSKKKGGKRIIKSELRDPAQVIKRRMKARRKEEMSKKRAQKRSWL